MKHNTITRALLLLVLCLGIVLPGLAQAPVGPQLPIGFEVTVHQSEFYHLVPITATSPVGVSTIALDCAFGHLVGNAHGAKSITTTAYVFGGYFPDGDYTLSETATDMQGNVTRNEGVIHLIP